MKTAFQTFFTSKTMSAVPRKQCPAGTAKVWLKGFFLTAITLLLIWCAAVIIIDPFFQYHNPLPGFAYTVDNQLSQNPGMAKNFDYDSVILGSSMTVNFNASWFRELLHVNPVKLNYDGAYPKDQSNILDIIYHSGNTVDAVFLGIDIPSYSGDVQETKYPIPAYLYDDNYINDVQYLLNKDVMFEYIIRPAVKSLLKQQAGTDFDDVYATWPKCYYGIGNALAGYQRPEKQAEKELPADTYLDKVTQNMTINICPYIEAHPETTFYVFYPPYSILFWDGVRREGRLDAVLAEYETISDILLSYDNVRLFFFANQKQIINNLDNYTDYTHYSKEINYYMTQCFQNGKCEVTVHNLKSKLNKMRKLALAFDYDALFAS